MFTLRDRRTGELFDRRSYFGDKRRRLMEQSWAGVFRNHLLVELPVDDLCRHLDERMGRPSKDLHVVIGVLLLQQLHDLSDAETVEALAFNMAWHYALDVRSEADSYFCEKTLRNYRRLFIEQGLDELLFRCFESDKFDWLDICEALALEVSRKCLMYGHFPIILSHRKESDQSLWYKRASSSSEDDFLTMATRT